MSSIPAETAGRPILMRGQRAGLAMMLAEDIPVLARWNQDLAFTARLGQPGEAHSIEQRQRFFEANARWKPDGVEFGVIDLATMRLIGFGGLFEITPALVGTLFIGIGEPAFRGRGLGTEACRLICEYGFFFRNLHSIKVEVHGFNRAALRLYQRLGFKLVGRLRGANLLNGRRHDEVVLDLLRDELELCHVGAFADLDEAPSQAVRPPHAVSEPP